MKVYNGPIRQPHGPRPDRNFKIFKYNLEPVKVNEFDWVVPEAYIPKTFIIKDKWIKKNNNEFIYYDVYLTNDKKLCFYKNSNELCKLINLEEQNCEIIKKNINNNYYFVIKVNNYSVMYRVKNEYKLNLFFNKLKELNRQ